MKRRNIAQHAPGRTPSAGGTLLRMLGISLAVVTVSAIAVAGFVAFDLANRVGEDAVPLEAAPSVAPPGLGAYPGAFSILLIGTDECGPVSKRLLGERCASEDGILNDINLLVHVSAEPRTVSVVSLPRDLMVKVPSCVRADGSTASALDKAQINSVFERAGLSCVAKTVSGLSGLEIGFAAKLSFDGVMEITDAIGGVEICIGPNGLHDRSTGLDWPPGPRTVQGYDALQFLRVRKGLVGGSDLSRISNQQQYMSRLASKVLSSETLTDLPTVMRLASTVASNVKPSESLVDPVRLAQLALALKDVPFDDFVFLQLPTLEDPADRDRVVENTRAAQPMWDAIIAGEPLQITGRPSTVPGAVVEEPSPTASASAPASPTPSATPIGRAVLSEEISGIDLTQRTCTG